MSQPFSRMDDFLSLSILGTLLFPTIALFKALIRPYKKTYMNVFDAITLVTLAVLCHTMTLLFLLPTDQAMGITILNCYSSDTRTTTCNLVLLEDNQEGMQCQ